MHKKMLHWAVSIKDDTTMSALKLDHQLLKEYFQNSISLCGAIYEFDAIAVCSDLKIGKENKICKKFPSFFDDVIYGEIILIGSDANGQACDLNAEKIMEFLNQA